MNGCNNRPRPTAGSTYIAQDGWREYEERGTPVRKPIYVAIKFRMSTDCQYDKTTTDPGCAGCAWRKQ